MLLLRLLMLLLLLLLLQGELYAVRFSVDGRNVATAGADRTVCKSGPASLCLSLLGVLVYFRFLSSDSVALAFSIFLSVCLNLSNRVSDLLSSVYCALLFHTPPLRLYMCLLSVFASLSLSACICICLCLFFSLSFSSVPRCYIYICYPCFSLAICPCRKLLLIISSPFHGLCIYLWLFLSSQ